MNKKTTIGIIIALLMITSTFTFTTTAEDPEGLFVTKQVWDGDEWVDDIDEICCDHIRFRINVTYYAPHLTTYYINNTIVIDTLPVGLEYDSTIMVTPTPGGYTFEENNSVLTWDFGEQNFTDGTTIFIIFDVNAIEYGEQINHVSAIAEEHCQGELLYGEDTATVHIIGLELEKKVWDSEALDWVDQLDYVLLGEPVAFKITGTYHGEGRMTCGAFVDYLPDLCLEYIGTSVVTVAGEVVYPGTQQYPDIIPDAGDTIKICQEEINITELIDECPCLDGEIMVWDFRNAFEFELHDGEAVEIIFLANVTEYCKCPDCTLTNYAAGLLWGCSICDPCNYLFDCDYVTVECVPQPTNLKKRVWDGDSWAEETTAVVGETVTFQLKLSYFGSTNLTDIQIIDYLPECLDYANDATIPESNVSTGLKTVWWNLTDVLLNDTESLTIEFDALVVDTTECDCGENIAVVTAQETDGPLFEDEDNASIIAEENSKPTPPLLEESTSGEEDETLSFQIKSLDSEGNDVYYFIDWGDGTDSGWIGPYTEGIWTEVTNSWDTEGTYSVKAKAKDEFGQESDDWGNSITVTITGDGTEPPPEGDNITISDVSGGFRKVDAVIENTGEETIDVNWSIMIEGRLLSLKNVQNNGTDTVNPGDSLTIQCQPKFLAFGRVIITVEADAPGYGTDTREFSGFQIGPFILFIRPV